MHIPQAHIHKNLGQCLSSLSLRIGEFQMVSGGIRTLALQGPSLICSAFAISNGFQPNVDPRWLDSQDRSENSVRKTFPRPLNLKTTIVIPLSSLVSLHKIKPGIIFRYRRRQSPSQSLFITHCHITLCQTFVTFNLKDPVSHALKCMKGRQIDPNADQYMNGE